MSRRLIDSPLGPLLLTAEGGALVGADFLDGPVEGPVEGEDPALDAAAAWFAAYFAGQRPAVDLPLAPAGTDFQRQVWAELVKIAYAGTLSYGELAVRLGDAKRVRAVGLANGRNPIAVIIPCHRVIGADGSLVGYAGGLHRKRWLLEHEAGPRQARLF